MLVVISFGDNHKCKMATEQPSRKLLFITLNSVTVFSVRCRGVSCLRNRRIKYRINDVVVCIVREGLHAPVIGGLNIL